MIFSEIDDDDDDTETFDIEDDDSDELALKTHNVDKRLLIRFASFLKLMFNVYFSLCMEIILFNIFKLD